VLVAEQLFASGCSLLISVTSAGQLLERRPPPYFILIERALRDEGTSYHYTAPSRYSAAEAGLIEGLAEALRSHGINVHAGSSWTTDAPFRETAAAIEAMRDEGLEAVEMEAAALYAFASARRRLVVCFAHITNRMAKDGDDFEKGQAGGAHDALALIEAAATRLLPTAMEMTAVQARSS
jgi:uridine phosphorylase